MVRLSHMPRGMYGGIMYVYVFSSMKASELA